MTKKNINKFQNVQNLTARIITRLQKFDHITPVLTELKWLSVESMLVYRDCILVFKCLRGLTPDYPANKFKKRSEIHNKDTRNKNKVDIPGYRPKNLPLSSSFTAEFLTRKAHWAYKPCINSKRNLCVTYNDNFRSIVVNILPC